MPTKCFMVDRDTNEEWQPGAIVEIRIRDENGEVVQWAKDQLSPYYWRNHADKRPPLAVVLPCGDLFMMDMKASNAPGWTVTGEAPTLTVRPSIGHTHYHGWLTDGVLSDDLEGRTYG